MLRLQNTLKNLDDNRLTKNVFLLDHKLKTRNWNSIDMYCINRQLITKRKTKNTNEKNTPEILQNVFINPSLKEQMYSMM